MSGGFDRFRRHVMNREQERKKGKGGRLWQMEEFQIATDQEALVRFLPIPEDGMPYVRKFHWPPGGPPKTCTAEMADFGGKCVYCHYDQEHKAIEQRKAEESRAQNQKYNKARSPFGQKTVTVMEVVDFRYYHLVPGDKPDSKVAEICNVEGPEEDPSRCEFCDSQDPDIKKRVFGGGRRWEFKDDQLQQLMGAHSLLQKVCVHVKDNGEVCGRKAFTVELLCHACSASLVDPDKVRRMGTKDLEAATKREYTCPECGEQGYPDSVAACESNEHDAVRGTIFDKVMRVSCTGETKALFGSTETYEEKNFAFDISEPFMSVEDALLSWGFEEEEIKKICAPQNLNWKFRPERLDPEKFPGSDEYVAAVLNAQADSIKQPNPFAATKPAGGFNKGGGRTFRRT